MKIKIRILLVIYVMAHGLLSAQIVSAETSQMERIRRGCTHNRVYGTSVLQHRTEYYRCLTRAYKRAEELREKRLRDKAFQAIIEANNTYQKNSKDREAFRRLFYEKYNKEN